MNPKLPFDLTVNEMMGLLIHNPADVDEMVTEAFAAIKAVAPSQVHRDSASVTSAEMGGVLLGIMALTSLKAKEALRGN